MGHCVQPERTIAVRRILKVQLWHRSADYLGLYSISRTCCTADPNIAQMNDTARDVR